MKTFQKLQKKFVEFASVQQQCEIIPPTSATIRQYILLFYKQRNSIDVFRNKESNKTHLARAAKKLTANIYHFGVTSEASLICRKIDYCKCSCKKSCRSRYKCFQQERERTELYSCSGQCTLTNSKGVVMQIRKPEINNLVNRNTNFYFLFCFLIVNKTFIADHLKISEREIFRVSYLC